MTQPSDDATLPPATRALKALVSGPGWRPLAGSRDLLIFIHPWPDESVDTLAIRGETDALAERTNPAGEPVWRRDGTLIDVIDELRELPPPDAATAPRLVIGVPRRQHNLILGPHPWTPG